MKKTSNMERHHRPASRSRRVAQCEALESRSMLASGGLADVIFVVDESGSMMDLHEWIPTAVTELHSELNARGVTDVNYGLVGFGSGRARPFEDDQGSQVMSSDGLQRASRQLSITQNGDEDGYVGLEHVLRNYPIREDAALNIILVTDEDRDAADKSLTFKTVLDDLRAAGAKLNVVVDALFEDTAGVAALGVDSSLTSIVPLEDGGFTTSTRGQFTGIGEQAGNGDDEEEPFEHYVTLAWRTEGAAWDLNQLRAGGDIAKSFVAAFVATKTDEIIDDIGRPDLVANELTWTPTGIQYGYSVEHIEPDSESTIGFYWSDSEAFDEKLRSRMPDVEVQLAQDVGAYGPFAIGSRLLPPAPPGTSHLLMVVDPKNTIRELNEGPGEIGENNVRVLQIADPSPGIEETCDIQDEQPVDLSTWRPFTFFGTQAAGDPRPSEWSVDESGKIADQKLNADASYLLSDFEVVDEVITGSFRVADRGSRNGNVDDDYVGFVFAAAHQSRRQRFYLFDWKAGDQQLADGSEGKRGMSVKVVDLTEPYLPADFGNTDGNGERVKSLFHNDVGWKNLATYRFELDFQPGQFAIRIWERGTRSEEALIEEITIEDATYESGRFGFYNYSQGQALYSGFTRRARGCEISSPRQPPVISVTLSAFSAAVGEVIAATGEALAFGLNADGDENQIVSVSVDGKHVDSLDSSTGTFSTRLTLEEGTNTFVFTATDELGQTAKTELSLEGIPVVRPDLVATGLRRVPSGVEFGYTVTGNTLDLDTTAALFWIGDDFAGDVPERVADHVVTVGRSDGDHGPFNLEIPSDISAPPNGTTQVMLVLDPENNVHESDETTADDFGVNNVLVIPFTNSPPEITELSVTPRINENDSVILRLVFSDGDLSDQHTVTIDWANGTGRSVEVVDVGEQQRSLEREYTYLDDQPSSVVGDNFVISVSVTDQKDVSSRNVVATVNNLPPVVETPGELTVGGDGTVSLPVSFTDVGSVDTHQASIDWGDGSPVFELPSADIEDGQFTVAHEYGTANSEYIATVRVTDDDGGVGEATTRVVPLAFDILPTSLVIQDEQVSLEWQIRGQDIVVDSSVALYWSDDESFDPIEDSDVLSIGIEGDNRRMGTYDHLRQVADITTELPPDSAEFLLMVVDPENTVELDDETNNVLATPLPMPDIEVLNAATSDFTFFQLSYQIREFPARPFVFGAYLSEDALLDEGDLRVEDLDGLAEYDASEAKWRYLGRHNVPDDFTAFVVESGVEIEDARFVLIAADPDNRIAEADEPNGTVGLNNVAFAVPLLNNNQKRNRFGEINAQINETGQDASGSAPSSVPAGSNLLASVDALFARSTVPISCAQEECLAHPHAVDRLAALIDLLNAPQSQASNAESLIINSAWSETGDSPFHLAGLAFDFTPVFDGNDAEEKMARFAGLAWLAGFDFVWRTPDDGQAARVHASARHKDLILGDTNFDGAIDFTDFLTLSTNFGLDNRIWSEGDFTGDGTTAFDDFLILADAFGTE